MKFCSLFLYVLILLVCCFKFGYANPLYISCDKSYINYCKSNIKNIRIEAGKTANCGQLCALRGFYEGRCDCNWLSNGTCYNYMYCWKNGVTGLCSGIYNKDQTGDNCLYPSFLDHLKKYEFKVTIGNSKFVSNGFNALKKKGQTKTCKC